MFLSILAPLMVVFGLASGTFLPALVFFPFHKPYTEGEAPRCGHAFSATALNSLVLCSNRSPSAGVAPVGWPHRARSVLPSWAIPSGG